MTEKEQDLSMNGANEQAEPEKGGYSEVLNTLHAYQITTVEYRTRTDTLMEGIKEQLGTFNATLSELVKQVAAQSAENQVLRGDVRQISQQNNDQEIRLRDTEKLVAKLPGMQKDIADIQRELKEECKETDERLTELESWKWRIIGAATAIGALTGGGVAALMRVIIP